MQTLGAIFTRIFRALPRFSANQKFWGCACIPFNPTSNTTACISLVQQSTSVFMHFIRSVGDSAIWCLV